MITNKQFTYYLDIIRVVDGDTLVAHVDMGCDVIMKHQTLRLWNCDTPEVRGNTDSMKTFAQHVRRHVTILLTKSMSSQEHPSDPRSFGPFGIHRAISRGYDRDGFGRLLVDLDVVADDEVVSLSEHLIEIGYATPYFDKKGKPRTKGERLESHQENLGNLPF